MPELSEMRWTLKISLLVLLLAGSLAGCRKGPRPDRELASDEPGPPSPMRDVLIEMHQSLLEGRKEDHLATFVGDESEMRVVETLFDFHQAGREFRRRFVEAYGRGQWEDVRYDKKARLYLPPEDTKHYEHAIIEETSDDTAEATVVRGKLPMELRKTDDGWRVEASSFVPRHADARMVAEINERWTEILTEQSQRIGRHGLGPVDIRMAVGEQFGKAAKEILEQSGDGN